MVDGDGNDGDDKGQKWLLGIQCIIAILLIVGMNAWLPVRGAVPGVVPNAWSGGVLTAWLVTVAAFIWLLAIAGEAIGERPAGVLIDNRNRISLSKLQMIGWTVLILSSVATISATMIEGLAQAPATLFVSTSLLTVMGISLGTAAATPAVLAIKPDATDTRPPQQAARWYDLLRGDDESNAHAPDISKIQQLLITLIVMGVYAFRLGNTLHYGGHFTVDGTDKGAPDGMVGLPDLGDSLTWMVGISHAGYLAYKAVPHTDKPADAGG